VTNVRRFKSGHPEGLTKVREVTLGVLDVSRPDGYCRGRTRRRVVFIVGGIVASAFDPGECLVRRYLFTTTTS